MKIVAPGNVSSNSNLRRAGRATGSGESFAAHLKDGTATADVSQTEAMTPVKTPSALLGLQEIGEAPERRRRVIKRGENLLAALEALRDSLLTGAISEAKLRQLTQLMAEDRPDTADPHLQQVLNEIELRAAVELAKRSL